jgi:hypothetical protein
MLRRPPSDLNCAVGVAVAWMLVLLVFFGEVSTCWSTDTASEPIQDWCHGGGGANGADFLLALLSAPVATALGVIARTSRRWLPLVVGLGLVVVLATAELAELFWVKLK